MIVEDLEDSVELMRVLQNQQMMPGQKHTILERSVVMQSITPDNGNGPSVVPIHVAQKSSSFPPLLLLKERLTILQQAGNLVYIKIIIIFS